MNAPQLRHSAEDASPSELRRASFRLLLMLLALALLVVPILRELPLGQSTRTGLLAWLLVALALYWLAEGMGYRPLAHHARRGVRRGKLDRDAPPALRATPTPLTGERERPPPFPRPVFSCSSSIPFEAWTLGRSSSIVSPAARRVGAWWGFLAIALQFCPSEAWPNTSRNNSKWEETVRHSLRWGNDLYHTARRPS